MLLLDPIRTVDCRSPGSHGPGRGRLADLRCVLGTTNAYQLSTAAIAARDGKTGYPGYHKLLAGFYLHRTSNTVGSNQGDGRIEWSLYSPEKVIRSSTGIKLNQKTTVAVQFSVAVEGSMNTSFAGSVVLPDCGAKAQSKGVEAGKVNQMKLKLKCKDLLGPGALNLTADQQAAMSRVLNLPTVNDKALSRSVKAASFTASP